MAERPIFVPTPETKSLVREIMLEIPWAGGFSQIQKKKNIESLHSEASFLGYGPTLEASTKSNEKLGRHLSAFSLKKTTNIGPVPLESVYQGSKVFELGGPYTDLLQVDPKAARSDPRLVRSGRLIGFNYEDKDYPLVPTTAFYDWLYISCIYPHRVWLDRLYAYSSYSDIEYNPKRSINCQARALALFVSLKKTDLLEKVMASQADFFSFLSFPYFETRKAADLLGEDV